MARCIKKYNCQNNGEMIMSQINTFLSKFLENVVEL